MPLIGHTYSETDDERRATGEVRVTGDGRPATGDGRPATGDGRPATGDGRPAKSNGRRATSDENCTNGPPLPRRSSSVSE